MRVPEPGSDNWCFEAIPMRRTFLHSRALKALPCFALAIWPVQAQPSQRPSSLQAIWTGSQGSVVPVPNGWAETALTTQDGLVGEAVTCADGARAVVASVMAPAGKSPAGTAEAICARVIPPTATLLSSSVPCKSPYTLVRRYQWGGEGQAHFEVIAVRVGGPVSHAPGMEKGLQDCAVYTLGASATTFGQDLGTLTAIWENARLLEHSGLPVAAAVGESVTHEEETEKAFQVQTPPGWSGHANTIKGGGQVAHLFTLTNADQSALILFEQPYPMIFAVPSAETAAQGWQPESVHEVGGARAMVLDYQGPGAFMQTLARLDPVFQGVQVGAVEPVEASIAGAQSAWVKLSNPLGMSGEVRCSTMNYGKTWLAYLAGWVAKPGAEGQTQKAFVQAMSTFKIHPGWAAHNLPNHEAVLKAFQTTQEKLIRQLRERYPAAAASLPVPGQVSHAALQLGSLGANAQDGKVVSIDPHLGKRPVLSRTGRLEFVASNAPTPAGAASLSLSP